MTDTGDEVPEADRLEQQHEVAAETVEADLTESERDPETPEADALEQAAEVPLEDDH
jgi:hypothetical protein